MRNIFVPLVTELHIWKQVRAEAKGNEEQSK